MFKDYPIFGQILALTLLAGIMYISIKSTKDLIATDKVNYLLVLIVSALVGVWIIDNVIAFQTELLDKDENKFVLQCLWTVVTFVIGRQSNKPK